MIINYKKGQVIGKVIYVEDAGKTTGSQKRRLAKFKCKCGNLFITQIYNVKTLQTKSCGCGSFDKELSKKSIARLNPVESGYHVWHSMKCRCNDKLHTRMQKNYADKGITLCKEWANSYEKFIEDMGERPSIKHTVDRIDYHKGYFKENCRWATSEIQTNNRSNNIYISYNGMVKTLNQWSKHFGIPYMKLYKRYRVRHWAVSRIFT